MSTQADVQVESCDPQTAWKLLEGDGTAVLVDVRSRPEWSFVGVPDLSSLGRNVVLVEWRVFPDMRVNETFIEQMLEDLPELPSTMLFICRSGARSLDAARHVATVLAERGAAPRCINVDQGFEGDLDAERHRASVNGWKNAGLPWQQS